MEKRTLTIPELMFVIGTRAMLAAGVAFLVSGRLSRKQRKIVGTTLVTLGAITTVPAAMIFFRTRGPVPDKIEP